LENEVERTARFWRNHEI